MSSSRYKIWGVRWFFPFFPKLHFTPMSASHQLFTSNNDWMILVLGYLNMESICCFDIAVTSKAERDVWLYNLRVITSAMNEHWHCSRSIQWLIKRRIRLECLKLRGTDWICDRVLSEIARNCPFLTEIDVSDSRNVTDNGLVALAHNCRRLTTISFSYIYAMTDVSLIAIAEGCPGLESLSIDSCDNITDKGALAILSWSEQYQHFSHQQFHRWRSNSCSGRLSRIEDDTCCREQKCFRCHTISRGKEMCIIVWN